MRSVGILRLWAAVLEFLSLSLRFTLNLIRWGITKMFSFDILILTRLEFLMLMPFDKQDTFIQSCVRFIELRRVIKLSSLHTPNSSVIKLNTHKRRCSLDLFA